MNWPLGLKWDFDKTAEENTHMAEEFVREKGLRPSSDPLSMLPGGTKVQYTVKDSGQRQQFQSGMQRDTEVEKIQYDLVFDGPLFERLARHLTLGAKKYQPRNWMLASSDVELSRFRSSAIRHFVQWLRGDTDEDHFSAVVFNLNGYEYTKERMRDAGMSRVQESTRDR